MPAEAARSGRGRRIQFPIHTFTHGEGTRAQESKMDEAAEAFMEAWLDANITRRHAKKPSARTVKSLANRCIADAAAQGISLDSLENVVVDIEEAITDELNVIASMKTKTT
jgi:hypothetical protein